MSPKNRLRISVKRQVFSVLTIAYFQGPVNLKPTVYPSTSTLNISQYCMMFGLTYKRCLQFDCRSYISFGVSMLVPPLISIVANPLRHSSVIEERVHSFRRRRAQKDLVYKNWCAIPDTLCKLEWTLQIVLIYTPISREGFVSFCLLFAHTVGQPISRPWKWQTTASHYNQNNWV